MDLPTAQPGATSEPQQQVVETSAVASHPGMVASTAPEAVAPAGNEVNVKSSAGKKRTVHDLDDDLDDSKDLTDQQRLERRERNREHAKRSRLRKKFLLESLQEQIHGLEEQLENLKTAIRSEIPTEKAEEIIKVVCGDKDKYTPLPMPSGFGPVKTLMEPDFRLSK